MEESFIITPHIDLLEKINTENSFYAEIISTKTNKNSALKTYQFAMDYDIPIVATNPIYFLREDDYEIHKLVTAIRLNKTIETLNENDLVDEEYYFKNQSDIEKYLRKFLKLYQIQNLFQINAKLICILVITNIQSLSVRKTIIFHYYYLK